MDKKKFFKWTSYVLIILILILMTFINQPKISSDSLKITQNLIPIAIAIHIIVFLLFLLTIKKPEYKHKIYLSIIFLLLLTCLATSIVYKVQYSMLITIFLFVLVVYANSKNQITFDIQTNNFLNKTIGIFALVTSFYYIGYLTAPVYLKAFAYSSLGTTIAPTLLMISGLLILTTRPRSRLLEIPLAVLGIWFGFIGLLVTRNYADIPLIITGIYLTMRITKNYFDKDRL